VRGLAGYDIKKLMRNQYFPPTFEVEQFHCIHCGVFARQEWYETLEYSTRSMMQTGIKMTICSHCDKKCFWFEGRMVVPAESPVEPAHPDLPDACLQDYTEAKNIFSQSPRAAAALLRLCIQKLMPHLGEKGDNINDDIKSLVAKGLPALVQKALDFCRVVGNNAVHPGEINLNDTPEVAQNLFRMINFIVEDKITRPQEIESLYNQLPESSRKAISKRDTNT